MPHATMKLIPGIDTYKTPALNEAAFSASQLIRFVPDRSGMGLIQKLGGWVQWATQITPNINELHPWEDLNTNKRLAVGANDSISYIEYNDATNTAGNQIFITPESTSSNSPASTYTVTISNATPAEVTATGSSYPAETPIVFTTTGALPSPLVVGTVYYVATSVPAPYATPNKFGISTTIGGAGIATTTVGSGTHTITVPFASTTSGSSVVTIYDTGLGVQSASFTNGSPTIVTAGITFSVTSCVGTALTTTGSPALIVGMTIFSAGSISLGKIVSGSLNSWVVSIGGTYSSQTMTATVGTSIPTTPTNGTKVRFTGSGLPSSGGGPTGFATNTDYYVVFLTSTTFELSTSPTGAANVTTTSIGSGTMYAPNQIQTGFSVGIETPISVANLYISGVYEVVTPVVSSSYYNIYNIDVGTLATSTTGVSTIPEFTPTNDTSLINVESANHPYQNNYTATFLTSTTSAGVTIYGNYFVTYVDSSNYEINTSSAATSSTAFFMNSGNARYQYYFNIPSAYSAAGYGANASGYGGGGYGAGEPLASSSAPTITTTDWVINNFGEILTANPQNGPIYYWTPSRNTSTMYLLDTAPMTNTGHFIAMPSRQIVAYGSTATGIQDPLLIRWSDAGDATVWQAFANNQAGSFRIAEGSMVVGGIQASQQALIWTDLAVWAMQYVGYPNVFGFNKLADGVGLIAKKAVGILGRATYWMSPGGFNVLADGGPQDMACPVWDQIFQNLNTNYLDLIRCATNSIFDEVTWYYPSASATYNDSYVKYNTTTQAWDYGTLNRVAWCDQSILGSPIGADNNGYIWQHEIGYNAGNQPMVSSFETGYMQLNDADNLIFIDQIWPDFKWQTTSGSSPSATVYLTFYGSDYPGDTPIQYGPYTMTSSTQYLSVRIRNRLLRIACSTADGSGVAATGTFFRIGALRYRAQLDGKF